MADSTPPRLVVKIGSAGDLHLDFKPASLELMREAVGRLNQAGGIVVYYGESPYQAASEAALATFKELVALKPRILLGTNAPSEWGRLDWWRSSATRRCRGSFSGAERSSCSHP